MESDRKWADVGTDDYQCRNDAVACPMCKLPTYVCLTHLDLCPTCHKPICDECRFEHCCNGRRITIQTIAGDIRAGLRGAA